MGTDTLLLSCRSLVSLLSCSCFVLFLSFSFVLICSLVLNLLFFFVFVFFFFSSRRRHTRSLCDWSSDVCSSDLGHSGIRAAEEVRSELYRVRLAGFLVVWLLRWVSPSPALDVPLRYGERARRCVRSAKITADLPIAGGVRQLEDATPRDGRLQTKR